VIVRHQRESASNKGFRHLARYIQGRGAKPRATWFHAANLPGVGGKDDLELACKLVDAVQAQNTRAGSTRTYHLVILLHPTIGASNEGSSNRLWIRSWILWGFPSTNTSGAQRAKLSIPWCASQSAARCGTFSRSCVLDRMGVRPSSRSRARAPVKSFWWSQSG
jgi:hypothetical protein